MPTDPLKEHTGSGGDSPLYKLGEVVVYKNFYLDQLHVVDMFYKDGSLGITGLKKRESWLQAWIDSDLIRPATRAEKKARQRLP